MSSAQQPPLATATTSGMAGQPTSSSGPGANGGTGNRNSGDDKKTPAGTAQSKGNYKGFVAGVFSGVAKLSGMFCLVLYWGALFCVMCDEVTSDEDGLANQMISCGFSWASVCGFIHIILTPILGFRDIDFRLFYGRTDLIQ